MRYFLVTFNILNVQSIGSITVECEGFPSHFLLEKMISELRETETKIIVLSFFEFKTEEDFKDYRNET